MENVQLKDLTWILGPNGLTYKESSVTLDISPLCIPRNPRNRVTYQNHERLHRHRLDEIFVRGWTMKAQEIHKLASSPDPWDSKCVFDFWFRACQLANLFNAFQRRLPLQSEPQKQTFPSLQSPFPANPQRNQPLHLANIMWLQHL